MATALLLLASLTFTGENWHELAELTTNFDKIKILSSNLVFFFGFSNDISAIIGYTLNKVTQRPSSWRNETTAKLMCNI